MERGKLIAFEGLDGCGKTTQLGRFADQLRKQGIDPIETREPTDGETGRKIRSMARSGEGVDLEVELEWFFQDRREHVDQVIQPGLDAGRWVLCDRYTLSSVAYQGGRGLDPGAILERGEAEFPVPDLVLLFELSAARGLERVLSRGGVLEPHFEKRDFLERVSVIFDALDRPYIERVDATGEREAVTAEVLEVIERRFDVGFSDRKSPGAY